MLMDNSFSGNKYNYSGINRFTRDIHNYYENSHFRIRVGREIMDEIYQDRQRN